MPNYGPNCKGCSGEDCCCCEVWLEAQADARAMSEPPEFDDLGEDEWPDEGEESDPDDCPEDNLSDAEADAQTLASAGQGTDEDYGRFDETPLGEQLEGE